MLKLFWIGVGEKDQLANVNAKNLADVLKNRGIKAEFRESEGGQHLDQLASLSERLCAAAVPVRQSTSFLAAASIGN